MSADTIIHNAKIATNSAASFVEAVAIRDGKIVATGKNDEILRLRGPETTVIDGKSRTVIPGLNDSHMHLIRGGLNYNLELRWDGVPSLADALRMLKEQARERPRHSGCEWSAAGANFSLPSAGCRRSTKSTRPLRTRPSSCCTCMTARC